MIVGEFSSQKNSSANPNLFESADDYFGTRAVVDRGKIIVVRHADLT